MDKAQKFDLMNKVVRELEDLQNSQTALITKISQIEVDNMNGLNDSYLEKQLDDMHAKIADNVDTVNDIFSHFEGTRDEFAKANNLDIDPVTDESAS